MDGTQCATGGIRPSETNGWAEPPRNRRNVKCITGSVKVNEALEACQNTSLLGRSSVMNPQFEEKPSHDSLSHSGSTS